jgi:hypothetical protein
MPHVHVGNCGAGAGDPGPLCALLPHTRLSREPEPVMGGKIFQACPLTVQEEPEGNSRGKDLALSHVTHWLELCLSLC